MIVATQSARFSILTVDLPDGEIANAGVLLEDPENDRLYVRLRRDWERIAPAEADVLSQMEDDLRAQAKSAGAARAFEYLEDTLSNTLRISDRREVIAEDFERSLARLYRENVTSSIEVFVTHLPRYSLAVAAGKFLENPEVTAEGWEEAPEDLKLTREMFVAKIQGQSMEPKIPDGSLCVFRAGVTGSRDGRLVLVEARGENDRYAVKRYRSQKQASAEGAWSHTRITLEPLNPQFEAWDLEPENDRYRILAEFVRVLD